VEVRVALDPTGIAALALEHDLLPIARDRHLERIPQLLRG
jgi:predicted nucleic acid-binding protein